MATKTTKATGPKPPRAKEVVLIANGDLRLSANQVCWPAQKAVEDKLTQVLKKEGWKVKRAHGVDRKKKHGFIDSQKMGMEVFRNIHPDAPLIVVEAVWQYSHHVLHGLITHRGPILTIANWSGQWPGLVGMLNLNGSLTKAGVSYSTLWSEKFSDKFFKKGLKEWLETGEIRHDTSHVQPASCFRLPEKPANIGRELARELLQDKAIMGVFDEGCMGMFNAIIPDHLLNPLGVYKERLSQSALFAEMQRVSDEDAQAVRRWLNKKGLTFLTGENEETDLTDAQILLQCRMYVSAVRIADEFGCATIGIQYQQGLKDLSPASDLVEGILNNVDRPPVYHAETREELFKGQAVPHFNEVDECAGIDALITNRIWTRMKLDPETTLHDLRWGEHYKGVGIDDYVWVFLISGAAPAQHFIGGYKGATSERQPPMYFPLGGGTLKGISKPGEVVWSRVYMEDDRLKCDLGIANVVKLPQRETERRWKLTTSEWPIMHAVLPGITRDQMMARHKANHIQVAYAPNAKKAQEALAAKIAMFQTLGVEVFVCGKENGLTAD